MGGGCSTHNGVGQGMEINQNEEEKKRRKN
jgi:hypothetical protein